MTAIRSTGKIPQWMPPTIHKTYKHQSPTPCGVRLLGKTFNNYSCDLIGTIPRQHVPSRFCGLCRLILGGCYLGKSLCDPIKRPPLNGVSLPNVSTYHLTTPLPLTADRQAPFIFSKVLSGQEIPQSLRWESVGSEEINSMVPIFNSRSMMD